ncbi:MAG: MOSC domain-containing protein [Archangium sp.]|nr:MOSC domain-containing protein [Archangium sp.]
MRVLAVSVGQPAAVSIRGRSVSTAFVKRAVSTPVRVLRLGLEGDGHVTPRRFGEADHAVYAYPHEHYARWAEELERGGFPFGQFGENLTIDGLLETRARIGDVLRVGTAVLQVAHPRLPCEKLDQRLGLKLARRFLESRRVGFYLRVLEEGVVCAGDALEVLRSTPTSPTVDEFVRISQFDYWDVTGLEGLLQAEALAPGWARLLEEKLALAQSVEGWLGSRELEVFRRVDESDQVVSLWLRCPHGRALAPFRAGQHVTVELKAVAGRPSLRRAYAISSAPRETTSYRISVRRPAVVDAPTLRGLVSSSLCDGARVGTRVRVAAPRGAFTLGAEGTRPGRLVFACEDIGLAPVMSMLHAWADAPAGAQAWLLFAALEGGHPFEAELAALRPRPELRVARGALPLHFFAEALGVPGVEVFVAGQRSFVEATRRALEPFALPDGRVHFEEFG